MRSVSLLPLTLVVTMVGGCGSEESKQVALFLPQRDLTLEAQPAEVKIASPVELQHLRKHQTARPESRVRRSRAAQSSSQVQPKAVLAAVVAAPAPILSVSGLITNPAGTGSEPLDEHELPPGKTVTVIPASSGPSPGTDVDEDWPTDRRGTVMVGGGGTCPPSGRRPGIGIGGFPHPVLR